MGAEPARPPRAWFRWVRVAVALGLVGFIASRAGLGELSGAKLDWRLLALATALVPACLLVRSYNHMLLLNRPNRVLGLRDAFVLTLVGVGIGLVVPTGAADLAKAHWGWRTHGSAESMVVSTVLDKLTSLTALCVMGAVGSWLAGSPVLLGLSIALALGTLVPFVAPDLVPWRFLLRVLAPGSAIDVAVLREAGRPPLPLLAWVWAVSAIGWVLTYSVVWLSCLAVGAAVSASQVIAIAPVSSLARMLPVSVAGIGVGEVTLAAFLGGVGVPADLAARSVLLSMILLVLAPGSVGVLLLARGRGTREVGTQ